MPDVASWYRKRRGQRGDEGGDDPELAGVGMKERVVEADTRKPSPLTKSRTTAKLKDTWVAEMCQPCKVSKGSPEGAVVTVVPQ